MKNHKEVGPAVIAAFALISFTPLTAGPPDGRGGPAPAIGQVSPRSSLLAAVADLDSDAQDPRVVQWKRDEIRVSAGRDPDAKLVEQILVVGAGVLALFVLWRLAC